MTLTHVTFVESFRRLLKRVGVDPVGYSGHSFRRGGASCAFQAGVPGELVQLHGDWRSDAYLRYLTVTQRMRSFISHGSSVGSAVFFRNSRLKEFGRLGVGSRCPGFSVAHVKLCRFLVIATENPDHRLYQPNRF